MNNIRRLLVFKYFKGCERFIDFLIFIIYMYVEFRKIFDFYMGFNLYKEVI